MTTLHEAILGRPWMRALPATPDHPHPASAPGGITDGYRAPLSKRAH
jgi:hypothetical protein